jgi:hypothetical protein
MGPGPFPGPLNPSPLPPLPSVPRIASPFAHYRPPIRQMSVVPDSLGRLSLRSCVSGAALAAAPQAHALPFTPRPTPPALPTPLVRHCCILCACTVQTLIFSCSVRGERRQRPAPAPPAAARPGYLPIYARAVFKRCPSALLLYPFDSPRGMVAGPPAAGAAVRRQPPGRHRPSRPCMLPLFSSFLH